MADPSYIVNNVLTDGEAYVSLGTTTLGSDTSLIAFTSTNDGQVGDFSQYMDLFIIWYGKSTSTAATTDTFQVELNDVSAGTTWSRQRFNSDGASVAAIRADEGRWLAGFVPTSDTGGGVVANVYGICIITLFDINSGKYKSAISQYASDANGQGNVGITGATWQKQEAITKVELMMGYNQVAGTTLSIFGILPSMLTTGTLP